jgi:hypothetical protein
LSGRRSRKLAVDRRHEADETACLEALKLLLTNSARRTDNGGKKKRKGIGKAPQA